MATELCEINISTYNYYTVHPLMQIKVMQK